MVEIEKNANKRSKTPRPERNHRTSGRKSTQTVLAPLRLYGLQSWTLVSTYFPTSMRPKLNQHTTQESGHGAAVANLPNLQRFARGEWSPIGQDWSVPRTSDS